VSGIDVPICVCSGDVVYIISVTKLTVYIKINDYFP
jgi:hypothetical protein